MSDMPAYDVSHILCQWYATHCRALPWRETRDPYRIWISEVILQQTRVAQGMDYYRRFLQRFPDVCALADADEQDVLHLWQGLGYYSRARNLHAAARTIRDQFSGHFPTDYAAVRALPGIGDYTAAAIVSFACNAPYAVVDGNVLRVLGRLFAIDAPCDTAVGRHTYNALARELMPPEHACQHNQAIMEFGALQCVPRNPDCNACPLAVRCAAHASGDPHRFPVKQHRTKPVPRYFHYFYVTTSTGHTYLHRRPAGDIWQGLFELPLLETSSPATLDELMHTPDFRTLFADTECTDFALVATDLRHVLTHRILHVACYTAHIQHPSAALRRLTCIPRTELSRYPFPRLIQRLLELIDARQT